MPKYKGKELVVEWLPAGGTAPADVIDLSGSSREFSYSGEASDIDVTTRDSVGKEKLVDDAEYEGSLNGLDTRGTPDWEEAIEVGDTGTLTWYPEGKGTGKRKRSVAASVSSVEFNSPHDNAAKWQLGFAFSGQPAKTAQT